MPVSSKRAQRGRRDLRLGRDAKAISSTDAEIEPSSSPTRPAKRRKKVVSPQPDRTSSNIDNDPDPPTDYDQIVSQVTQQLKAEAVQASKDHANAIHVANGDGVKAYAKVAAQDWTFYITKLAVNIGRAPEVAQAVEEDDENQDHVHIDLGPSKMVSRAHAAIVFDSKDEKWMLQVKGRNGAKVNGQPLKPLVSHPLTSGEVIEIGNVEMMFVLPSEISPLHVHPAFLQRCGLPLETTGSDRQAAIAPAPTDYKRPGTPLSTRRNDLKSPAVSTPAVIIGASGVDLSLDENQHIKPQYSYAQMITQAILNAQDEKLNLNGIYTYIMDTYSYYRNQQAAGWQNSIRHNLSLNKSFDKVARSTDEPGKGMKWQIVPEAREEMVRNATKGYGWKGYADWEEASSLTSYLPSPAILSAHVSVNAEPCRSPRAERDIDCGWKPIAKAAKDDGCRVIVRGLSTAITDFDVIVSGRQLGICYTCAATYTPQACTSKHRATTKSAHANQLASTVLEVCRYREHAAQADGPLRESFQDKRDYAASEQQSASYGQITSQQPNAASTASTTGRGGA
ncbi:Transcription factor, fork head [Cordyceps fumosorosea ARSEF 2679]|uniref:Transcription factor, fork head n=1 Tax=Cordyceps fumosorosea (strain ARSEF 2679) TaxID=1081104 RepID=A0A162MD33_CORFA|nr:Transcription factor, fork head [Cordyceps fumosorosea ARSEF 2679]OAA54420.1 Transcription factor, fork head [Cordyceps fumosorosea ARSEF 2679]